MEPWQPPAQPQSPPKPLAAAPSSAAPSGIGGWLLLPLLGLASWPFMVGYQVFQSFQHLNRETWGLLTTPGTAAYHPLYWWLIPAELVFNVAIVAASIVLLVLFLRKSARVPKLMIAFYLVTAAILWGDTLASTVLPHFSWDRETVRDLARSLVGVVVWVPYFLTSARVRNTFGRTAGDEQG